MAAPLTIKEIELMLDSLSAYRHRHRDFGEQIIECQNRSGLWFAFWASLGPDLFWWRIWFAYRSRAGNIHQEMYKILQNVECPLPTVLNVHLADDGWSVTLDLVPTK